MKPRTQAELDALYAQYPGLEASMELSRYCDYWNNVGKGNRAFGTGLGPEAAEECRWLQRCQEEEATGRPSRDERFANARGGRK